MGVPTLNNLKYELFASIIKQFIASFIFFAIFVKNINAQAPTVCPLQKNKTAMYQSCVLHEPWHYKWSNFLLMKYGGAVIPLW